MMLPLLVLIGMLTNLIVRFGSGWLIMVGSLGVESLKDAKTPLVKLTKLKNSLGICGVVIICLPVGRGPTEVGST